MTTPADALAVLASGDWEGATSAAERAAADQPGSHLARALAGYLGSIPASGLYQEPAAFQSFVDNGANPALYRRTIEVLSDRHTMRQPASVLDIGCGDGRVTSAVLGPATERVDLVEPSAALLAAAAGSVEGHGAEVVGHQVDAASFLAELEGSASWDLVQSTFAIHATRPDDRPAILAALARRTSLLLIVEFDVPAFADRSPEHIAYLVDHYEQGLREYRDHPEVVSQFLLPVLVGQLDRARPRFTFEQPIDRWVEQLGQAGFRAAAEPIFDYWWATANLVTATTPPG